MKHKRLFIFLFILVYSNVLVAQNNTQVDLNKINVETELQSLNNDLNDALTRGVNVLSPQHFKSANTHLNAAKENIDDLNVLKGKIHRQINTAREFLNQANTSARLSRGQMDEVMTARQFAVSAGAPIYFAREFQRTDDQLLNVAADLEKNSNRLTSDKSRSALRTSYLNLELRAIRHQNLGQAGLSILQALKEGAREYVPEKYEQTLKNYKEARDYIARNRHNTEEIKSRSVAANESANQLLQTTREVAEVRRNATEAVASVQDVITTEQSAVVRSRISIDKLNQIKDMFSPNEAEVYLQDDILFLRLRGLKFPVSKAVLENSDIRLLGKVQRVIKDFKDSQVIVEGHTDNVGSKEINDKISLERAQTIRDYLLSIDAVPATKVRAAGLGEDIPVATNSTPEGRAANRRVDILIKL